MSVGSGLRLLVRVTDEATSLLSSLVEARSGVDIHEDDFENLGGREKLVIKNEKG